MSDRIEVKILTLVAVLLIAGILAAGFMVITVEKSTLYRITEESSKTTADIIAKNVQRTMLDGRSDLTKELLRDMRGVSATEQIMLLNWAGRMAFDKSAPPLEAGVMKEIAATKAAKRIRNVKSLIFYNPLLNSEQCQACHAGDPPLLGAVKISFSIEKEYDDAMRLAMLVIGVTIAACLIFSFILWITIRKMVIVPVKSLENEASKLSGGDLSFDAEVKGRDEIGRFSRAIRNSLLSISGILRKIKDSSRRVVRVTEQVEMESKKVVEGTVLEAEAVNNISASIEEFNDVISEIADGTDGLAASAEETAASMEQLVSSITQITSSTHDLSSAAEATSASIEELSATLKEVAGNTSELESAATDTQAAIIEITTSIKEVEGRARESASLSDKVKNDAVQLGMVSVEKTIKGMQDIKEAVRKTADYIGKLGGRSMEIGTILNVIDEITDQTTMLALNAAILAAQAGEHGKGFSVVADEIKELADRTSASTQEIADLIQAVQQEVADAVTAMDAGLKSVETGFKVTNEAVDALRKIVETSRKSSEMAAAIERATAEQASSAKLVSSAMEKVLSMVGQIAKATSEQTRGIQLIVQASDKIGEVAKHVRTATDEQSVNSKQISRAVELVSDKSQQISRAINEQKAGSDQILSAVEKIKDLPKQNRERAFKLNQLVKDLLKDAELTTTELGKFHLPEDSADLVRLGIIPLESPAVMFKKFSPLGDYLAGKLGRPVDLKVAVDFQSAVEDVGQGVTQLCFMTPSTYIEAREKFGVKVLVKALRDGKPFQHSVIVARADSGIDSLEEIKGRSFAFGDPHSTSSHIVPRAMLLSAGVDVKDLSYYNYLGHHDDVAKAVLNGEFDAGGVMESTATKFRDMGLKLIRYSEDIAEFNICVSGSLDPKVVNDVRAALVGIDDRSPEGSAILKSINSHYTGFVDASDEDYNNVKVMMSNIGLI
jgi:phosphate/phosphite/phosphonate ABC transporter binding protein